MQYPRTGLSFLALIVGGIAYSAEAQVPLGEVGSSNLKIVSHVPLGRMFTVADIEIEQELGRPFVYVPRMHGITKSTGFSVLSVKDPADPSLLYTWNIENPELIRAYGGLDGKYFKLQDRYYYIQSFQIAAGSQNHDLGAIVFDVTGLPDASTIKEAGRIRTPDFPGGFHNIFAYKHSDGRVLLLSTSRGAHANVFDMAQFLAGEGQGSLIARIPIPDAPPMGGGSYHDMYAGYDPATRQDKFYGAAWNSGYYIFDISQPDQPSLITSITGVAGGASQHTFTPTPDGRYVVAEMEYQYAPLRIFDLKPGLDGEVTTVSRPIGAWTARWQGLPHNHEVRWPYVFVSGYEDGLHVFNMMDPTNPYTVAYYDTYGGPNQRGWGGVDDPEAGRGNANGSFGVDVRNADGLIVTSDMTTGFWAFKLDGFNGWNGHQWGMPNISSVQDWDNGPEGAPAPVRVSD